MGRRRSLLPFRRPRVSATTKTPEAEAWRRGLLRHKLKRTQREMLAELESMDADRVVLLAGRRGGKTWLLAVLMFEFCLRNPGAVVRYAAATAKSIRNFLLPIMEELLQDCPADVYPVWNATDGILRFPHNGASIAIAGCDNGNYKQLRGGKADLQIVDEAAFIKKLRTVVVAVLAPQTLTTGGRSILATSAPDEADSEVIPFIKDARADGACVERTIYQRVGDTLEEDAELRRQLAQAIEDCGGEDSPEFRREYGNELVFDTPETIIPEWTRVVAEGGKDAQGNVTLGLVREVPRPAHCHKYVAWDPGFTHHAGVVLGYHDFEQDWLVLEDEIDVVRHTTDDLAPLIAAKEKALWGSEQPFYRVMDQDPEAQEQMRRSGIYFHTVGKKNLRAHTNQLRVRIAQRRLIIHPRCKVLVASFYAGTWARQASETTPLRFKEHPKYGHFDVLAATIYLNRSVRRDENPFPAKPDPLSVFRPQPAQPPASQAVSALRQAFAGNRGG